MLLSLLFQRPKQAPSAEKSRNSLSHREHRTFRYKDKPYAHTGQRTSPSSPYVTGPCCHVLRVTHQTDFSSDRSDFSPVITANPRRRHYRWLSERSIPLWAFHIIFLSGYPQSETTSLHGSGLEGAGLSTTASMEVSLPRHLSLILSGTKRPSPRQRHLKVVCHRARPRGVPTTGTARGRYKTSRAAHLEETTEMNRHLTATFAL